MQLPQTWRSRFADSCPFDQRLEAKIALAREHLLDEFF